jgi:ABC-type sulfate/molybdate transport systems ATPase subunit
MEDLAHEGQTMIVVTHEMQFAREAADRVYFMDQGVFAEIGPPDRVIDRPQDERTRQFLSRFLGASQGQGMGPGDAPAGQVQSGEAEWPPELLVPPDVPQHDRL